MEMKKNGRGFRYAEFKDRYGVPCSIQKSSLAFEDAIWFGCDDADPKIMLPNNPITGEGGWTPVPMLPGVVMNTRMHLTREMVQELLPTLQHFADTGELPHE